MTYPPLSLSLSIYLMQYRSADLIPEPHSFLFPLRVRILHAGENIPLISGKTAGVDIPLSGHPLILGKFPERMSL